MLLLPIPEKAWASLCLSPSQTAAHLSAGLNRDIQATEPSIILAIIENQNYRGIITFSPSCHLLIREDGALALFDGKDVLGELDRVFPATGPVQGSLPKLREVERSFFSGVTPTPLKTARSILSQEVPGGMLWVNADGSLVIKVEPHYLQFFPCPKKFNMEIKSDVNLTASSPWGKNAGEMLAGDVPADVRPNCGNQCMKGTT